MPDIDIDKIWAYAVLIRDSTGNLYLQSADVSPEFVGQDGTGWSVEELAADGAPIEIILDAYGNPPTPEPEPRLHSVDADVAWAHYRKTYQPNPSHMAAAHKAFHVAWDMAITESEPVWLDAEALDKLRGLL